MTKTHQQTQQDDATLGDTLNEVLERQQNIQENESQENRGSDGQTISIQDNSQTDVDYKTLYETTVKQLEEYELIAKRAQSDYFRQKIEFDAFVARREEEKKTEKIDAIIAIAQKIIPALANLQVSLMHIPVELDGNRRVEGIKMTAEKQLKDIELLGIIMETPIVGSDVDFTKVIPVGTESVEDESFKGKILKVLDNIYIYRKDGVEKIVLPGKVIVGA